VSRRRKIALGLVGVIGLLILAATFWDPPEVGAGDGHLLVLDPRTGRTLHDRAFAGGWIVAALLSDGRIAVAHEDSCQDHEGGALGTWNATLARQLGKRALDPCTIARLDPRGLRKRMGETGVGLGPAYLKGRPGGVSVPLDHGKIVEHLVHRGPETWYGGLTAYDGAGNVVWKREFPGKHLGIVDARSGVVTVPVAGKYTPGTD
jgi:hypothetical protein